MQMFSSGAKVPPIKMSSFKPKLMKIESPEDKALKTAKTRNLNAGAAKDYAIAWEKNLENRFRGRDWRKGNK